MRLNGTQAEPTSETPSAQDVGASSSKSSELDVVEKLSVVVHQKCSTDETSTSDQAASAEHDGTGATSDQTTAASTDVTGSGADKTTDTDRPAPRQQLEKECGEETMETENAEDPEISFKKQAKHEPRQADVDAKKEAHDVNRNSEAISTNNEATCSA